MISIKEKEAWFKTEIYVLEKNSLQIDFNTKLPHYQIISKSIFISTHLGNS